MYSVWDTSIRGGFPHSDISGSKSVCRLPEAFRRLQRPSSPMIAKASTMCTYSLDSIALGTANLFRSTLHAPLQRILSFGEFDLFVKDDSLTDPYHRKLTFPRSIVPLFYSRSDLHLLTTIASSLDLNLCLSWEERWCNRINQNWSIQAWLCFWGQSLHWIESISISHHFQIVKEHWAGIKPCQLYSQMDKHETN